MIFVVLKSNRKYFDTKLKLDDAKEYSIFGKINSCTMLIVSTPCNLMPPFFHGADMKFFRVTTLKNEFFQSKGDICNVMKKR